tara:strand:+ start:977 stop:1198 length:222 start_codon:yes stop_codon:yes gene_type:complete
MKNIEKEIQFIEEAKEYIIDLIEKDFKTNNSICSHNKKKIKKQLSWLYYQEIDYIESNSEDYLDGLDNQQEQN